MTRLARRALVVVSVLGALVNLAFARTVVAQSGAADGVSLEWSVPPECPDASWMKEEIARLVSATGTAGGAPIMAVRAVVERPVRGPWRVVLRTEQGPMSGERSLEAQSCQELARAVTVVLALAVHQSAQTAESVSAIDGDAADDSAASTTEAEAPATHESAEAGAGQPASEGPEPARLLLGASVAGDVGTFSRPALGASVTVGATIGRLRLVASGSYWPKSRATAPSSAAGGEVSLIAVGARGCYAPARGRLELAPCAGAEVGTLQASGFGVDVPRQQQALWVALTVGGMMVWHVTDAWGLRLELGTALPLIRDTFILTGIGTVNRPGPIVGRGEIGAELRF